MPIFVSKNVEIYLHISKCFPRKWFIIIRENNYNKLIVITIL